MATKTYPQGALISTYSGHGPRSDVEIIVWSPDGKYIASQSYSNRMLDKQISHEEFNKLLCVHIWEVDTGKVVTTYDESGLDKVKAMAWSPDSRRIALGYLSLWSAAVLVWDTKISKNPLSLLRKQTILRFLGGSENSIFYKVASLAWSPDGRYIASGGEDRTLLVLDPLKYF